MKTESTASPSATSHRIAVADLETQTNVRNPLVSSERTTDVNRSLRDALQFLQPAIRARREEIEQTRRMPRDLVDMLRKTGLFSLNVPRAIGGKQIEPIQTLQAIETVAAADGSTGWCAMIATANNLAAGYMPESGAREVFADATAPSAGIAAPAGTASRVDGGVRVSGRWPFASGIDHCEWVWAGCIVTEQGKPRMTPHGPEIVHVCMPVREVVIHDTWHVSGLCGTGSNDFSATDVFVPENRIFALLDPSGHRPEPLYQMPPFALFVAHVASVSLGIARGALDEITELAQTKVPTMYKEVLADRPVAQLELARAEVALGAARSFLHEKISEMWKRVSAGRMPSAREVALARAAATHAVETAAAVTRTVNVLGGGSAIYTRSSLQRHARDAEAITHHFTIAPHTWESVGRILLGREAAVPVF
jgi:indole-3-acetate monooxygenase